MRKKIRLTESDFHKVIAESVKSVLREMNEDNIFRNATRRGIKCDGMGAASPVINKNGEFMKAYKWNNGFVLCIGGPNGTRPIPSSVWNDIKITSNGTGLTLEQVLQIMMKIGDYYRLF